MESVLIVIHLIIVLALVGVVLLQRSEGGGLGIGGGGGGGGAGGFMSSRGAANVLTRATALLAVAFFGTSIALTILAGGSGTGTSILDQVDTGAGGLEGTGEGLLDTLQQIQDQSGPQVPTPE
ncbi:MAG: preprotein translocase subunit SecG [Pseudomonadota bacterium]